MAIFLSDVMKNGALPARGIKDGESNRIAARVRIPAGTVIAQNDVIKIARLAPNVSVRSMLVRWDDLDGGSTLDMDIGWVRAVEDPALAYNASTNPEVSDGAIAGGETADDDYFVNAGTQWTAASVAQYVLGQSGLPNEFTVNDVRGLDGYADVAIQAIAAGAASTFSASTDAYIDVELEVISPRTALTDGYDYDAPY